MRCYRCKEDKPEDAFGLKLSSARGRQDWCRECKNAWKRDRPAEIKRAERQSWKARHREKHLAQKACQKAVARGTLVRPDACERCGGGPVQGHHPDYEKRLEVVWLCPRCHGEEHAGWTWPVAA